MNPTSRSAVVAILGTAAFLLGAVAARAQTIVDVETDTPAIQQWIGDTIRAHQGR